MRVICFYDLMLIFVVLLCFFDIVDFIGAFLYYASVGMEFELGSVLRLPFLLAVLVVLFFYRFNLIAAQREIE